ncbi:MAG: trypsin-like serine protease [Betaproteobacteria bacterium]|nr:trypsin-like serine protease [Betaproteobacteria bacterium]
MRHSHNSNVILPALAVLISSIGVGCGEEKRHEHRDSRLNIVGGRAVQSDVDDARRYSTVALTSDHLGNLRSRASSLLDLGKSFCTATVISRKALMTAAHCLQDFDPQTQLKGDTLVFPRVQDFIASFGLKAAKSNNWIRAKKVIPHPDWNPELTLSGNPAAAPNDIGIVLLDEEIPEPYSPVEVASEDFELTEKQQVTLVGYGVTLSRRNNNTGLLREVSVPLQDIDTKAKTLNVGGWMKGACAGDSGGPMYTRTAEGKWVVVGVTSAGIEIFQTCIGLDNSYTDARHYKDWIRSKLRENGDELM